MTGQPPTQPLDLAVIGNNRIAALMDTKGRLVWWCFPRLDSDPVFCRLIAGDEEKGFSDVVLSGFVKSESHYVVKTGITIPQDVEVLAITPHAHYLGKDMKIDAHLPDGSVTHMIWIKDWDFNWQGQYRYSTPVKLPKGTRVELEYTYDNSAANPRNPSNPPVAVHWGEQTTNEMAVAFMSVKLGSLTDEAAFQRQIGLEFINEFLAQADNLNAFPPEINPASRARLSLAIGLFDRNHDGKLDAEERKTLMDFLRARIQ